MHIPVLKEKAVELWSSLDKNAIVKDGIYVDATFGRGGHTEHLLEKAKNAKIKIIGIDRDAKQIEKAREKFQKPIKEKKLFLFHDSFSNLEEIISSFQVKQNKKIKLRGVLFDFGIATNHLFVERGFSFQEKESPLDMRFNTEENILTAAEILNSWREEELYRIFQEYGEERFSKLVAREIVKARHRKEFSKVNDLLEILERILAPRYRKQKIHFATRIFQALRIAVNREYEMIQEGLASALKILDKQGRITAISFHSGEDRIVKNFFRRESRDCVCAKNIPMCICGHQKSLQIITRKPIVPDSDEIKINPKSRSAKLRAAEKI